jgi:hypothetical protein
VRLRFRCDDLGGKKTKGCRCALGEGGAGRGIVRGDCIVDGIGPLITGPGLALNLSLLSPSNEEIRPVLGLRIVPCFESAQSVPGIAASVHEIFGRRLLGWEGLWKAMGGPGRGVGRGRRSIGWSGGSNGIGDVMGVDDDGADGGEDFGDDGQILRASRKEAWDCSSSP